MIAPQPLQQAIQHIEGVRRAQFVSLTNTIKTDLHFDIVANQESRLPLVEQQTVARQRDPQALSVG